MHHFMKCILIILIYYYFEKDNGRAPNFTKEDNSFHRIIKETCLTQKTNNNKNMMQCLSDLF